jgi:hypothetical protein
MLLRQSGRESREPSRISLLPSQPYSSPAPAFFSFSQYSSFALLESAVTSLADEEAYLMLTCLVVVLTTQTPGSSSCSLPSISNKMTAFEDTSRASG